MNKNKFFAQIIFCMVFGQATLAMNTISTLDQDNFSSVLKRREGSQVAIPLPYREPLPLRPVAGINNQPLPQNTVAEGKNDAEVALDRKHILEESHQLYRDVKEEESNDEEWFDAQENAEGKFYTDYLNQDSQRLYPPLHDDFTEISLHDAFTKILEGQVFHRLEDTERAAQKYYQASSLLQKCLHKAPRITFGPGDPHCLEEPERQKGHVHDASLEFSNTLVWLTEAATLGSIGARCLLTDAYWPQSGIAWVDVTKDQREAEKWSSGLETIQNGNIPAGWYLTMESQGCWYRIQSYYYIKYKLEANLQCECHRHCLRPKAPGYEGIYSKKS